VEDAVRGILYPANTPTEKVCIPVEVAEVTLRVSPPDDEVAKDWDATPLPFKVEIVPPTPPASVPQPNVPVAPSYTSLSPLPLQVESPAPAKVVEKYPFVEVLLVMNPLVL
jgi:hypothetical protein